MENEGRKITKIAREVSKFTLKNIKETGLGTSEIDLIHFVRHHPGIVQSKVCESLHAEKGAIAKRVSSLEKKGYLIKKTDVKDKRKHVLFATDKAETLKNTKADIEILYYEWLFETLSPDDKQAFFKVLDQLYIRSKKESRNDFINIMKRLG